MAKKKTEALNPGKKGGRAVKKAMGAGWYRVLSLYRWGKISKREFEWEKKNRFAKSLD